MLVRRVMFLVLFVVFACAKNEAPQQTAAAPSSPPATTTTQAATTIAAASTTSSAAAAAPTPAAGDSIATAEGETPGVTVAVKELKRTSGGTLSLKFTFLNASDKHISFNYEFGDREHEIADFGSIGGVTLIDQVGKKKYFVARDSDGKCVCSQKLHDVKKGESLNVWAKFPAPPDDVQKISIMIPHFSPMDDVPISK